MKQNTGVPHIEKGTRRQATSIPELKEAMEHAWRDWQSAAQVGDNTEKIQRLGLAYYEAMERYEIMKGYKEREQASNVPSDFITATMADFIKKWDEVIVGGDNPKTLEGWAQDFHNEAQAILSFDPASHAVWVAKAFEKLQAAGLHEIREGR